MAKNLYPSLNKKGRTSAFTLVEIMFALVILGVIGTILTSFMVSSARSMLWSVNKSLITSDFRKFTGQITQDTYNASVAYLYTDFNLDNRDERSKRMNAGSSGDCLVLVQTEPFPRTDSQRFFRRIVVYYRNENPGPVFRQELVFPNPTESSANSSNDVDFFERFLERQINNFGQVQTVLNSTRGLAEDQLFHRINDETFLINGEIINGVNSSSASNTYNLTISTRG